VTSALLFVALLVVVDLSYRRWIRRSIARRMRPTIDLEHADAGVNAEIIPLPPRAIPMRGADAPGRAARRPG
jgi:hypothetical protein